MKLQGTRRVVLLLSLGFGVSGFLAAQVPSQAPAPPSATLEAPAGAEAVSLFGEPLTAVPMSPEQRQERERRLQEARAAAEARPGDAEAHLWHGRRAADLGHLRQAVDILTRALARFPDDPRLLGERGHSYITLRRFDLAVADLERAARLAADRPDLPETASAAPAKKAQNTLRSNLWFHLGIAHYLAGSFEEAVRAEGECLRLPATPDREAGARFWSYLALRRLGRDIQARQALAPVRPNMAVIESRAYLLLMLMFKGELTPDSLLAPDAAGADPIDQAILRYGVGTWFLAEGKKEDAVKIYRELLGLGQWHSLAHTAAEADLRRLGATPAGALAAR
ncbi:MAG TPA: tetratricopeptide repeat protein [Thermoanaerobaculia bacterium]|nr:tetratricopeptide repeat protein [Thermoanaerobaculia bacterium]